MKNIFITVFALLTLEGCNESSVSELKNCFCDSTYIDHENNSFSCYVGDKEIFITKKENSDTVEVKKFQRRDDGVYHKVEYLTLVNGKTDNTNSLYIEIQKLSNDTIKFSSISERSPNRLEFIINNSDTIAFKGGEIALNVSKIQGLTKINKVFEGRNPKDTNVKTTQIISFPFSYKEIISYRSLKSEYLELKKCGFAK